MHFLFMTRTVVIFVKIASMLSQPVGFGPVERAIIKFDSFLNFQNKLKIIRKARMKNVHI